MVWPSPVTESYILPQKYDDLSPIFEHLYRAPKGLPPSVFTLSRREAERLPRLPSMAIISITTPDHRPANLDGFDHVLRLSFADVDFLDPNLRNKRNDDLDYRFKKADAEAIWSFIDSLPSEITTIIVHCEGGFSRSCAIALALHQSCGYTVNFSALNNSNPSVVKLMMSTRQGHQPC